MRGKAAGIPGTIAAGPSGPGDWGWDFDGSYNDWYGGHEIGHTRGRYHAEFCGATGGAVYPYPNGRISPDLTGNGAIYGFDITTRAIYGPNWKDVMTYCSNEWVSDFTYEGIRSYLISLGFNAPDAPLVTASKYLAVMGMADLEVNTAMLESVNLIEQTASLPLPEPGDWTIALVNGVGSDLATYPFSPDELTDAEESPGQPAVIAEVVPWVDGATKVEIRYQGSVKASRSASPNPPTVTITYPSTGSVLSAGPFSATWTASDPDGNPLTFSVLYSSDNGLNWETLATGLTQPKLDLHTDQLPGGSTSLLRVVASDGLLTDTDTTGAFSVPLHAPSVNLELPAQNASFYATQTVALQASAYDLEDGALGDPAFHWSSNIDGDLGTGAALSTAELTTGSHTITLTVTDSDAMTSQVTRAITILDEGVLEATNLTVDPGGLGAIANMGGPAQTFPMSVRSTSSTEISWTASDDAAWLALDATSGTSPSDLNLTVNPAGLKPGIYTATITVQSAGAGNSPVTFTVNLEVLGRSMFLPLVLCPN